MEPEQLAQMEALTEAVNRRRRRSRRESGGGGRRADGGGKIMEEPTVEPEETAGEEQPSVLDDDMVGRSNELVAVARQALCRSEAIAAMPAAQLLELHDCDGLAALGEAGDGDVKAGVGGARAAPTPPTRRISGDHSPRRKHGQYSNNVIMDLITTGCSFQEELEATLRHCWQRLPPLHSARRPDTCLLC